MNELQQAMSVLASRLAHDLRNPLAVVLANLRHMQAVVEDSELQEALEESVVSADRLNAMLEDVVDITRLQAAPVATSDLTPSPLAELERVVGEKLELLVGNRSLEIDLPHVQLRTEPLLLSRVVVNLLEHALRHTPSRGTARLEGMADGSGGLELRVIDGGAPFDPALPPSFLDEQLTIRRRPASEHRSDQGLKLYFAGVAARALGAVTDLRGREDGDLGVTFIVRFPAELVS